MSSRLPEFVDPWRAADLGKVFSGRSAVAKLPRLSEVVLAPDGEVELDLTFGRDERKRACVQGLVRATLTLECQRCLGPMPFPAEAEVNLALVESAAEAERLPDVYDPLLVEESRIRLLDIVEDELLLSIPLIPKHEVGACSAKYEASVPQQGDEDESLKKENPFAVLAELKDKQN
jgi:uncharacterized protein